jgi:hypothetical protein
VLSITITLPVAKIVRPEPAQLLERLAAQWASYIAFLASFCYAGMNLSIRSCLVEDGVDQTFSRRNASARRSASSCMPSPVSPAGYQLRSGTAHLSGIFLVLPIFAASPVRV